jgi:hypothetical protein
MSCGSRGFGGLIPFAKPGGTIVRWTLRFFPKAARDAGVGALKFRFFRVFRGQPRDVEQQHKTWWYGDALSFAEVTELLRAPGKRLNPQVTLTSLFRLRRRAAVAPQGITPSPPRPPLNSVTN